jgi:hypothetical protein
MQGNDMAWLIILFLMFAGLHVVLLLPTQIAIVASAMVTVLLWIVWKLKWIILGIIGLEEIFGGRDDNA